MRSVFQKKEYDCGIACVAMLCGIRYERAENLCSEIFWPGYGIDEEPILNLLDRQGFKLLEKRRITQKEPVTSLDTNALLLGSLIPSRGQIDRSKNVYGHWAVWDAKERVVRDPYCYRKPLWLTKSYTFKC